MVIKDLGTLWKTGHYKNDPLIATGITTLTWVMLRSFSGLLLIIEDLAELAEQAELTGLA